MKEDGLLPDAVTLVRSALRGYYDGRQAAVPGAPVAWVTGGVPVELLLAAGITPASPPLSALAPDSQSASHACEAAGQCGRQRTLCSFARADMAWFAMAQGAPDAAPEPHLIVCGQDVCSAVRQWYEDLARRKNLPLLLMPSPIEDGHLRPDALDYVQRTFREMPATLQSFSGQKVKDEALSESLQRSWRAAALWRDIHGLLKQRPAPFYSTDLWPHLFPLALMRGTQTAIEYYTLLLGHFRGLTARRPGSNGAERFRIGWDNPTLWPRLQSISEQFRHHGAALLLSTYATRFFPPEEEEKDTDPWRALARAHVRHFTHGGRASLEQELATLARTYGLDAFVMHAHRACRSYAFEQYELARNLEMNYGLPVLLLDAGASFPEDLDESAIQERVDAFLHTLESRATA